MRTRLLVTVFLLLSLPGLCLAETTLSKILRLSKLAKQAYLHNRVSEGERYHREALEGAQRALESDEPSAFGQYPAILKTYIALVKARVNEQAARKNYDRAVEDGSQGLETLETVLSRLDDSHMGPIKDLLQAYFHIVERMALAHLSQDANTRAVEVYEHSLDVIEQALSQLRNKLVRVHLLKRYGELVKKLGGQYAILERPNEIEALQIRFYNTLERELGSGHPKVRELAEKLGR